MTEPARDLEQTVALVTGASSGIGEAAAKALAGRGAAVAWWRGGPSGSTSSAARSPTAAAPRCRSRSTSPIASRRLPLSPGRWRSWGLDVLVNNAGVMLLGPALDAPVEEWERMVHVNLLGLLYTAHAALPHLLSAAAGDPRRVADLVNISSVAGRQARKGSGVYNATKHGVGAFSESLRQEVSGRHLRVSLVEPEAVATELQSHNRPGVREEIESRFVDMDILQAEDIADAITYVVTRPRHVAINEAPAGAVGA